jgi:hypothetical protein
MTCGSPLSVTAHAGGLAERLAGPDGPRRGAELGCAGVIGLGWCANGLQLGHAVAVRLARPAGLQTRCTRAGGLLRRVGLCLLLLLGWARR